MRARRSCLSVPGVSTKMLAKARGITVDEVVIDLEDSVPVDQKVPARQAVIAALAAGDWAAPTVGVRINATDSPWCHRDVIEVIEGAGDTLTSLIVPKVQGAGDVEFVARLASLVELETARALPVALELLIETATGLRRVYEAATASARVEALIVGYADLAASLGRPIVVADDPGAIHWRWVLDTVAVAARSAGIQAIDGPHFEIADLDGLRARAQIARALGFDGKWALHPSQIEVVNQAFSPTQAELDQATAILEELNRAEANGGRGALLLDGAMIDEASRKRALGLLARGS